MRFGKKNFNSEHITLKFSSIILINSYTHLGFKKGFLHQAFRKATYGFHSNVTIINTSLTLANLKYATKFLSNLILKNNKIVFAFYYLPEIFSKLIELQGNFYIFNKWPAGLLSNPLTVSESKLLDLPCNFYPNPANAVVVVNADPDKSSIIANEAKTTLLPCFCFADSVTDLDFFSYWIPTNTKSGHSKLFYVLYINALLKKVDLVKKKLFIKVSNQELLLLVERIYKKLNAKSKKWN